jgi:cation-transporting ATPase 13A1
VGACLPLLCPVALPLGEYAGAAGLAGAAVGRAQERFGANSFEIPLPMWIDLYKEQLASPIAMFQLLCCVLWILDEYWKYTLFTLFMILSFEGTTALSRLKNMQQLRGMSAKGFSLHCYRDGAWVLVPSTSLLPSDIICLRRPAGAEPLTVPADCVVLRGGAVVNESTLTGESIPQVSAP